MHARAREREREDKKGEIAAASRCFEYTIRAPVSFVYFVRVRVYYVYSYSMVTHITRDRTDYTAV